MNAAAKAISPLAVVDLGVLSQVSVTHWRIAGFLATTAHVLQLVKGVAYEFNLTEWDDRMFERDHASYGESSSRRLCPGTSSRR